MADKFYAVAKGRIPGIYVTWDDCKKQTQGYSGAVYRSFPTFDEADIYLTDIEEREEHASVANKDIYLSIYELEKKYIDKSTAIAFVDGSFYEPTNRYSYGGIIIYNGKAQEFCESGSDSNLVSMRNVAGEILGAKKAMSICYEQGIPTLYLFYDYEGIEKWCTGDWRANKLGTQDYKFYYDRIRDKVKVHFLKVKGHTGVPLNERADLLAKGALGLL